MSGYCHKKSYTLRYTDFDFKDELKPSSLLALAQEAAASSADELGFGYEALKAKNYELFAPARLGETLTVETWPLPPRHVIFERDYRIGNKFGEIIALLASRWCLIDLPRFSMLLPEALGEVHARCPYNPARALPAPEWKIRRIADGEECGRRTVMPSDCDHYLHVNNARYADLFLDRLPPDGKKLRSFKISYARQAKEGAELVFFKKTTERGAVMEAREGSELIAQFEMASEDEP